MDDYHDSHAYRPGPTRIRWGKPDTGTGGDTDDDTPSQPQPTIITCIDYSPDQHQIVTFTDPSEQLKQHRPEWSKVRWINVDGLANVEAIRAVAAKYELHSLVVEDIFNLNHRPKSEDYRGADGVAERLFVIARMLQVHAGYLSSEQVSLFLGKHTLLTFQENSGDVFGPIRQKLATPNSRLRRGDASMLLYSLLDTMIDSIFPILETYADRLEELEERILSNPTPEELKSVHHIKRELLMVRRAAWPMREVIHHLHREQHVCLDESTQVYFRDVYDHVIQILDLLETYREFAAGLTEAYMSAVSFRMNDIMKILTIISTIFVPLTFLAGVYGMNMPIPENKYPETYVAFWVLTIVSAVGMLLWFRHKKWI